MDKPFNVVWNILKSERMNVLETFAGAGGNEEIPAGWGQAARDRGHNVFRNEIMYAGNKDEIDDKGKAWADVDLGYIPEMPGNILNYSAQDIIAMLGGKTPDVFYASPPCEGHSISARMQGWGDWKGLEDKKKAFNRARNTGDAEFFNDLSVGPTPTNDAAVQGRALMNHTLKLIDDLQDYRLNNEGLDPDDPMYWWMENPTGMMRFQPEVGMRPLAQPLGVKRRGTRSPAPSVTHASYSGPMAERLGFESHPIPGHPAIPSRKPTDLWTNAGDIWMPREHTKVGLHQDAPELNMTLEELQSIFGNRITEVPTLGKTPGDAGVYHQFAPRGARSGTQGVGAFTTPSGTRIPAYHAKSLIPYGLGLDTIIAVERARQGLTEPYPLPRGAQRRLF